MLVPRFALRVISCDDPNKWYANKVGQLVPYIPDRSKYEWKSFQDDGVAPGHRFTNFITKTDAVLEEQYDEFD
jgi:hypothetical protein|tara:strand:- start:19 stop:237 length:219 start_codon:yes stop_codon:yes gene_type:complete